MSRKPGIGNKHYKKFKKDIYKTNTSHVRVKGKKTKPPRYYDKLHQKNNPTHMAKLVKLRRIHANEAWGYSTPLRLQAEEQITKAKIKTLAQKL